MRKTNYTWILIAMLLLAFTVCACGKTPEPAPPTEPPATNTPTVEPPDTMPPATGVPASTPPYGDSAFYAHAEIGGATYELHGLRSDTPGEEGIREMALWDGNTSIAIPETDTYDLVALAAGSLGGDDVVLIRFGIGTGAAVNAERLYIYDPRVGKLTKAPDFFFDSPGEWVNFALDESAHSIVMHGKTFVMDEALFRQLLEAEANRYDPNVAYENTTDTAIELNYSCEHEQLVAYYSTADLLNDIVSRKEFTFTYIYNAAALESGGYPFEIVDVQIGENTGVSEW